MGSDSALVLGILSLILMVPSAISAFAGSRSMRRPALYFAVGGALIAYASVTSAVGYRAEDIPEVVLRVIAYFIR